MLEVDRIVAAKYNTESSEEESIDRAIRPVCLDDYIGQKPVCTQMEIFISVLGLLLSMVSLGLAIWRELKPIEKQ